jgi:hypothetical protein
VHSCFPATYPVCLPPGTERSFHEFINARCSCRYHISFEDRDRRLREGEAYVVLRSNGNGRQIPDWREIVLSNKKVGPPWCSPLRASVVEAAIAGKSRAVEHVAFYGLTMQCAGMYSWNKDVLARVQELTLEDLARSENQNVIPAFLRDRLGVSDVVHVAPPQPGEGRGRF